MIQLSSKRMTALPVRTSVLHDAQQPFRTQRLLLTLISRAHCHSPPREPLVRFARLPCSAQTPLMMHVGPPRGMRIIIPQGHPNRMSDQKNQYELTYVISGVVKQNQVDDIVRKITQFVQSNSGEIIEVDEWGNQRLAYEIEKKRSGYYVSPPAGRSGVASCRGGCRCARSRGRGTLRWRAARGGAGWATGGSG